MFRRMRSGKTLGVSFNERRELQVSTPRTRYMESAYNGGNDHTAKLDPMRDFGYGIDYDDVLYEDKVSSDTAEDEWYDDEYEAAHAGDYDDQYDDDEYDTSDPYDIEYDVP